MSEAPRLGRTTRTTYRAEVLEGRRRVSVYVSWSYPGGGQSRPDRARQPLLHDDRGPARRSGPPTKPRNGRIPAGSSRGSPGRSSCSSGRG